MDPAASAQTLPALPQIDVVIGIVLRADGDLLIGQRKDDGHLGGYWEFPGGKREPGESLEGCLVRELQEELAIVVRPLAALDPIEHDYPAVRVRLHAYLCELAAGVPQALASQQLQWVAPPRLRDFRFPPANDALISHLIRRLSDEDPATR